MVHLCESDYGGENSLVWAYMLEKQINTNAVILGSSVHNQRIERLNRDINYQVLNYYYNLFMCMEDRNMLDPDNDTDLYVLHWVFLPILNSKQQEFAVAYNHHPLSTEINYSPTQLYLLNLRLLQLQRLNPSGTITSEEISQPSINVVEVHSPIPRLSSSQEQNLQQLIDTKYNDVSEVKLYEVVSDYVAACLSQPRELLHE